MTCEVRIDGVSWTCGKPLKWRAMGIVKDDKGKTIKNVYGEPRSTKEAAWRSLRDECNRFEIAAEKVRQELSEQQLV